MPQEHNKDMTRRARECIRLLRRHYPDAQCSLDFRTVHQLMVATILSAQCTDERVNMVTPALFEKHPTVASFAEAEVHELAKDIYATGFHNSKAKAIKNSARQLLELYKGEIPRQLDKLVKLTGVGRKTASVILGAGYGIAEGIVVDTHVGRISRRLGFTKGQNPVRVEKDLMKIIPKKEWIDYAYLMIEHGRAICTARAPDCPNCFLSELCPSARV